MFDVPTWIVVFDQVENLPLVTTGKAGSLVPREASGLEAVVELSNVMQSRENAETRDLDVVQIMDAASACEASAEDGPPPPSSGD